MPATEIDQCLDILSELEQKVTGGRRGISIKLEEVGRLADLYLDLSDSDRAIVSDCINPRVGMFLIGFTADMAAMAIDNNDNKWLRRALALHVIEGFRVDPRENVRSLIFVAYASEKIGYNIERTIEDLELAEADNAKIRLCEFSHRDSALNQLKVFGVKEVKKNGTTRFVPA